jgi:exodeoxyribonuclease VII small subunit
LPQDPPTSSLDFEHALGELESLVERLERGDLPLEEALKTFERGVELTRHCQGALRSAQQTETTQFEPGQGGASAETVRPFRIPDDDSSATQE